MRRLGFALLLGSAVASANGRAPATNGVFFRPGDNQSIYVRTTFGLLISHDDGCHFNWVCEQNVGYMGTFDPKYAIGSDGTIFATTYSGLRVSHDGGCSFETATASLPVGDPNRIDKWIDALEIGPTGEIWVGTSDNGLMNDVYASTDGGATFTHRGMQSPTVFWKSVKVAPADANRIYITGYQVAGTLPDAGQMPPTAHFVASIDDGAHWTESALAGVMYGTTPIIYAVAVDPANKDIVFMTSLMANPPMGDRLYRSTDAGVTFTEVLATSQPIVDIVIRDAQTVVVATGSGGFISTTAGTSFQPMSNPPQLACLGQRGDGQLIGCGANWMPDQKAVDRSTDATTWSKVFRFVELDGPVKCPAGTVEHDMCDVTLWPGLRDQFMATGSTCGFAPDVAEPIKKGGGCCDAGDGGPVGMLIAFGVGAVVLRRRRREQDDAGLEAWASQRKQVATSRRATPR